MTYEQITQYMSDNPGLYPVLAARLGKKHNAVYMSLRAYRHAATLQAAEALIAEHRAAVQGLQEAWGGMCEELQEAWAKIAREHSDLMPLVRRAAPSIPYTPQGVATC